VALVDASDGRHDLTGGAEPALKRVFIDERLLDRMKLALGCQALDRRDPATVKRGHQDHASVHAPVINQERARAAFAAVAPFLGPRQARPLTKKVKERNTGVDFGVHRLAVYRKRDG
jgi:hypothetical protein